MGGVPEDAGPGVCTDDATAAIAEVVPPVVRAYGLSVFRQVLNISQMKFNENLINFINCNISSKLTRVLHNQNML